MPDMSNIEDLMQTEGIFQATVVFMHGNDRKVGWFTRMQDYGAGGQKLHRKWRRGVAQTGESKDSSAAERRWSEIKSKLNACMHGSRITPVYLD
jgi:hypothetical protein